ncbi:MAG: hypothetical protein LBQ50_07095 [Planctomycetaceae bacterium]|jgi:hypothetical protein|nr:hypothetical protein [Planctomycetaceae bacterium]
MILTKEEREIFYNNWIPLLSYVNDKYNIIKDFGHPTSPKGLNLQDISKIRDELWKQKNVIDEYINDNKMPEENIRIVKMWKFFIKRTFFVIKHYKKYSIFLDDQDGVLYGVNGITQPIKEILGAKPVMVEAVLLSFKNKIIYDSLIKPYHIILGSNIRKNLEEQYKTLKEKNGIITEL